MIGVMDDEAEYLACEKFDTALQNRYQRLSMLTLDLAEEAGAAAAGLSLVDNKGDRPSIFERRIAAMTRAIWAHRIIEHLRLKHQGGDQANDNNPAAPMESTLHDQDYAAVEECLVDQDGFAHGYLGDLAPAAVIETKGLLTGGPRLHQPESFKIFAAPDRARDMGVAICDLGESCCASDSAFFGSTCSSNGGIDCASSENECDGYNSKLISSELNWHRASPFGIAQAELAHVTLNSQVTGRAITHKVTCDLQVTKSRAIFPAMTPGKKAALYKPSKSTLLTPPGKAARSDCAVGHALDIIGDRWTLLIVRDLLLDGKKTYKELQESPEAIPTNTLAARLKLLEETALIEKKPYQTNPVRYEYKLTARGRGLKHVLLALRNWSAEA